MIASDTARLAEHMAYLMRVPVDHVAGCAERMREAGLIFDEGSPFQDAMILLIAVAAEADPERLVKIANLNPVDAEVVAPPVAKRGLSDKYPKMNLATGLIDLMRGYAVYLYTNGEDGSECDTTGLMFSKRRRLVLMEARHNGVDLQVVYASRKDEPEYALGLENWGMVNGDVLRGIADFIAKERTKIDGPAKGSDSPGAWSTQSGES